MHWGMEQRPRRPSHPKSLSEITPDMALRKLARLLGRITAAEDFASDGNVPDTLPHHLQESPDDHTIR